MNNDLAIIATARMSSERLPGKAMRDVRGQPLIYWIVRCLSTITPNVVLATTREPSDDALAAFVEAMRVPVYRGSTNDVVARIDGALRAFHPDAKFVLRGLGDCPFMAGELVTRAVDVMRKRSGDAFVWALPPSVLPVYGAREFPFSRSAWQRIVANATGEEREHSDMYFHRNRKMFNILYHEPPVSAYFRDYRLEVDWQEDLDLIRSIADRMALLSPLQDIIKYLDGDHRVALLNHERVERTGPSTVSQAERRSYYELMRGQPVVTWDDRLWQPPTDKAEPIFCNSGQCLLGYGDKGVLHRSTGDQIRGDAYVSCECGGGKRWKGLP